MITAKRTPKGILQPTMYTEGPRGLDSLNLSAMRSLCREEYTSEGILQPTMYTEGPRGLDDLNISTMRTLCREEYTYNDGMVTAIPRTTPTPTNDSHYFQHPSITYANTNIDKPEGYYPAHSPFQSWPST